MTALWYALAAAAGAGACFGFAAARWVWQREQDRYGGMLDFTRKRIGT